MYKLLLLLLLLMMMMCDVFCSGCSLHHCTNGATMYLTGHRIDNETLVLIKCSK